VFLHLLPEIIEEGEYAVATSFWILSGIITFFILEKFVQWRHCHASLEKQCKEHPLATMNLVGDGLHNFIDGLIIAASFITNINLGVVTTFAIALHEIPQEIGDFGVLIYGGFNKKKALLWNFICALTAVFGAFTTVGLLTTC
jgi:zinc and cadmium transporter